MGTSKLRAIVQGYRNYKFPIPSLEILANERATICSECPHCIENAVLKVVLPDKRIRKIEGAKCDVCKCPLSAKVRSLSEKCPKDNW
jgi:hypothetical protein